MNGLLFHSSNSSNFSAPQQNRINRAAYISDTMRIIVGGKSFRLGHIQTFDKENNGHLQLFEFELRDIDHFNNAFYAIGYGHVLSSLTGQSNWTKEDLNGDFFIDFCKNDKAAFIIGQQGNVYKKSKDSNWKKIKKISNLFATRSRIINDFLYITGHNGKIIRYNIEQDKWEHFRINKTNLLDIAFYNDQYYVIGENGFFATVQIQ